MRVKDIRVGGLERGNVIEIVRKSEKSGRMYYYLESEKRDGQMVMLVARERSARDSYRGVCSIGLKDIKRITLYPLDFVVWEN